MTRTLTSGMQTEVAADVIKPVWILRLDIETDPLYVWTGRGNFIPTGTGDTSLDGFTFLGLGNIGNISAIRDTNRGSSAVKVSLPGVDLNDTALKELLTDAKKWQFRQAWVWFGLLNTTYGVVVDPFRVKTGRMDHLSITGSGTSGTVVVEIESNQSFVSEASGTKYSEQKELIDSNDVSQDYTYDLANSNPGIGDKADPIAEATPPPKLRVGEVPDWLL